MRTCSMVLFVGLLTAQGAPAADDSRPNILFIMTDDQAAWAVSAAQNAHPQVRTPNIDRIYRQGAYLPNAFTPTPVCSPSRASLLTGLYGRAAGITDWIKPDVEAHIGLDASLHAWPRLLRQAGYDTALIGKWHLGAQPEHEPIHFGYDYFVGFLVGGIHPRNPTLLEGGRRRKFEGFASDVLTDVALAFIRRDRDGPFCLSLHYRAPHAPWLPAPEEDWAAYKDLEPVLPDPAYPGLDVERARISMRQYLASVAGIDRNVGRLLDVLDELKLADRTVVIFTSDHGYNIGHNGVLHKGNGHWLLIDPPAGMENVPRGQRPNLYDHSIRVPLGVRWPGVIRPGTVVKETVTMLDWFPTLLAMAGVDRPGDWAGPGRDFLPLLRGERASGWDHDLFIQYSTHHSTRTQMRGYRTPRWKLIRDFLNEGRDELYDLASDPHERMNLMDSPDPQTVRISADLDHQLRQAMERHGDQPPR